MSRLPINTGWLSVDEAVIGKLLKVLSEDQIREVLQKCIDSTLCVQLTQKVYGGLLPIIDGPSVRFELYHDHQQIWMVWMHIAGGTGASNPSLQRPDSAVKMHVSRGLGPHNVFCITLDDAIAYCLRRPRAAEFLADLQMVAGWWEQHKAVYARK